MRYGMVVALVAGVLCALLPVSAQDAISAKSGMVNYFEGKVLLNGEPMAYERAKFPQVPEGGTLEATMEGRAEVLLAPGVLMWLGEGGKIELVSDSLTNAKVRVLGGSVVVSATEFADGSSVALLVNDDTVEMRERGIVRIEASPASIYVYEGEANVLRAAGEARVKKGRTLALSQPEATLAKFEKDETTALLSWAQSRDSQIQLASLSAARTMASSGSFSNYPMASFNSTGALGYWLYNPYFGMYSFVPMNRVMMSPWGYYYYTPNTVSSYYNNYAMSSGYGVGGNRRGSSMSRSSVSDASSNGFGYSRGAASMGMGSYDGGRSMGGMGSGGYSRGSSSVSSGSVGGGASVPTSSGGASMGRGGESAGRGGSSGGGGRN